MLADAVAADDLADADADDARADMFQGGGGQRRTRAANGTILARATQPGPSSSSNCGERWERARGTTGTAQNPNRHIQHPPTQTLTCAEFQNHHENSQNTKSKTIANLFSDIEFDEPIEIVHPKKYQSKVDPRARTHTMLLQ